MTPTPQTPADGQAPRRVGLLGSRRRLLMAAAILAAVLAVVGLVAIYLFFFGSEAPPAPSIDDAIKVLLPSPPAQ